jgi:outer membrane protein OmpA-like peptidoglycan-associated protein
MASIFAALAAVVIAGTPISNLSSASLTWAQQIIGVIALVGCFGCIFAAVLQMLQLLRADVIYLTDIDPRVTLDAHEDREEIEMIRGDIAGRKEHFFPDFASLELFFNQANEAEENARLLGKAWQDKVAAQAPQVEITVAKEDYAEQVRELEKFEAAQQDMLAYGAYLRFYGRIRRAMLPLVVLGVGALAALLVFTLSVQVQKEDKGPSIVVAHMSGEGDPKPPGASMNAGTVFFETDSAAVDDAGRTIVEKARNALLEKSDTALLIIARTDTMGTERRNVMLARKRADAVRTLVVARGGIAVTRVFATEVPKSDLPQVTDNFTDSRLNRSASLYVVPLKRP